MDGIDPNTVDKLLDYGIAITVFVTVLWGFFTDRLASGKARDREVNRERELTDRTLGTLDKTAEAMDRLSSAWEQQMAVEEAVKRSGGGK